MKFKFYLLGLFVSCAFLCNSCKTMVNIIYKPDECRQGFSVDIPAYKKVGYINGESDWIYIFRYDDLKDGKLFFISYSYSSISVYQFLLNEKIEKCYGDSVFIICENGYKYLKDHEEEMKFTYNYQCKNGDIKTVSGHGNPNDVIFTKLFLEQKGVSHETLNIDTSSIILHYRPDTLVYEGRDSDYVWKSIEIVGKIVVGYLNVPIKEKRLFDKCLSTVKEIDDISLETDIIVKTFLSTNE